jgi:hypothetical protein
MGVRLPPVSGWRDIGGGRKDVLLGAPKEVLSIAARIEGLHHRLQGDLCPKLLEVGVLRDNL